MSNLFPILEVLQESQFTIRSILLVMPHLLISKALRTSPMFKLLPKVKRPSFVYRKSRRSDLKTGLKAYKLLTTY